MRFPVAAPAKLKPNAHKTSNIKIIVQSTIFLLPADPRSPIVRSQFSKFVESTFDFSVFEHPGVGMSVRLRTKTDELGRVFSYV